MLLIFFSLHLAIGQEGFQINGVKNNFEPIFAFKNATIVVSPQKTIEKGTLIIKGEKIISVDTSSIIPEGAIISDLNGDFIYPSFIDLYSDYGLPEIEKHKPTFCLFVPNRIRLN